MQEVAKEVEAIMKGVNDMAENMLPGNIADKAPRRRAHQDDNAQPLKERLLESWNGQVGAQYDAHWNTAGIGRGFLLPDCLCPCRSAVA